MLAITIRFHLVSPLSTALSSSDGMLLQIFKGYCCDIKPKSSQKSALVIMVGGCMHES